MKKALLFSLLLGSTFTWMNEIYAAEEAKALPAETTSATNSEQIIKTKIVNKGVLGEDISVKYHKEDPSNILYDNVVIQDGGIVIGPKHNKPFIPGTAGTPKGYKMINIWFPIVDKGSKEGWYGKYDEDFSKAIIQTDNLDDFTQPTGYTSADEYMWMLMSDDNEIFLGKLEKDENANDFYGSEMYDASRKKADIDFVRKFKLPNKEATAKLQETMKQLADLEEKMKSGGFAAAQSNASNVSAAAAPASSPFMKKFQFGDGMYDGKRVDFVLTTSDPKATPEAFAELEKDLLELCSKQPNVAVAIFSLALGFEADSLKTVRLYNKGLTATLMFSSEVDPALAHAYVEHLRSTSTMSPEDVKTLQEEHAAKAAEYEQAMQALEAERLKNQEMQAELQRAAAEIHDAEKREEIAKEVAAQALTVADEHKEAAVESQQQLTVTQQEVVKTEAELEQAKIAKEQTVEQLKEAQVQAEKTEAELLAEKEKLDAEKKAAEEKLEDAHERLSEAHEKLGDAHEIINDANAALLEANKKAATSSDMPVAGEEKAEEHHADVTEGHNDAVAVAEPLAQHDLSVDQQQTDVPAVVAEQIPEHVELPVDQHIVQTEVLPPAANGEEHLPVAQAQLVEKDQSQNDAAIVVDKPVAAPDEAANNGGPLPAATLVTEQPQPEKKAAVVGQPIISEADLKSGAPLALEKSLAKITGVEPAAANNGVVATN